MGGAIRFGVGVLCIYCDEFQAVGPAGTCDHCEPMPDAPWDQRGPEPDGKPDPSYGVFGVSRSARIRATSSGFCFVTPQPWRYFMYSLVAARKASTAST